MVGIMAGVGFVGMLLAPCAVALYSKMGCEQESPAEVSPETPVVAASAPAEAIVADPTVVVPAVAEPAPRPTNYTRRPVPLSTSAVAALRPAPLPSPPAAPVAVPSLWEVAEQAARVAIRAQADAAKARVEALQEASRAAAKRAEHAARLAEAAEHELVRASQAALQARTAKLQARAAEQGSAERDYLPEDHPSLDFPRSRVPSRRVA